MTRTWRALTTAARISQTRKHAFVSPQSREGPGPGALADGRCGGGASGQRGVGVQQARRLCRKLVTGTP